MTAADLDVADAGRHAASLTQSVAALMRDAAVRVLMPRYRSLAAHEQEEKSVGEVVTIADRECEALLEKGLRRILPGASVVGEEAVHVDPILMDRLGDDWCWIVDPLDGTGYYASGEGPFGIMIALARGGRVVGGWIYEPLRGRLSWAAAKAGSRVGGERFGEIGSRGEKPILGLSALLKRQPERLAAIEDRLSDHFRLVDIPRCAAALYPDMLVDGPDLALFERTLAWDHAPGVMLVEEAGGRCARLDGTPYSITDGRTGLLVARSPDFWEGAAALLQDLPA